MHLQIRAVPATSPPDLVAFLEVLANAGVSLLSAGGSDLELGGEFAFSVDDRDYEKALDALHAAGYQTREIELEVCWMTPHREGELLRCVQEAAALNGKTGSVIRDIALGEPDKDGNIPVMIHSQEIKTAGQSGSSAH